MTKLYNTGLPIWCAGCGHFGVKNSLQYALQVAGVELHETMVLAGIGCSGTVQNNMGAYGYHSMHGRVVPTAIGASLANPGLTVIAAAGDGDGYAIGGGHLLHALKHNPNILYVVMNNGVYGLTKGQDSPTAQEPDATPEECAFDAMMLGLSIRSTTFLARTIASRSDQMNDIMVRGLEHVRAGRGMAFIEILSPCVTYNDTYPDWLNRAHDVDQDSEYDSGNRGRAFARLFDLVEQDRIPIGMIYHGQRAALQDALLGDMSPFGSLDGAHAGTTRKHLESVLDLYSV